MQNLKTVNEYNYWEADTMQINPNNYTIDFTPFNIIVYYNPANHLIYLENINKKDTSNSVDSFIKWLNNLNEKYPINGEDSAQRASQDYVQEGRDCYLIKTDQGTEFQNKFVEQLDSYDIGHIAIPAEIDHLVLAGINRMCGIIRKYVLNQIPSTVNQTIDIDTILNNFMNYINIQHNVQEYKKPPIEITEEEVQIRNQVIRNRNKVITSKNGEVSLYNFYIGDIVQIRLKRKQFEKQRKTKWSEGLYKVINKFEYFYELVPMNFNEQEFKKAMKRRLNNNGLGVSSEYNLPKQLSLPVYFRKGYELKTPYRTDIQTYYPLELETPQFFTFDKIIQAIVKTDKGFIEEHNLQDYTEFYKQSDRYYIIQINDKQQEVIQQRQLRFNRIKMNEAEKSFWFDSYVNPNSMFVYNSK